jgi:acetyl esterase/lipase
MNKFLELFWVLIAYTGSLLAQAPIRIWDGTKERKKVELVPFLPLNGESRTAVIVCPGGSYCWLDYDTEGKLVAEWLRNNGIAAFVLRYRTAGIGAFVTHYRALIRGHQYPDAIQDLQRSIQLVRENAEEYQIDIEKVGVMGFSAGGHLVMSAGIYYDTDYLAPLGIVSHVSLRPDFVASIYPVVTFSDKRYVHKRSRRGLLGEWRKSDIKMQDLLSLEKHVRADCPPVFLLNCMDDPVVKHQNSFLLDSALTVHHVPHKYIRYKTGGHGFGADDNKGTQESCAWKKDFMDWLNMLFQ